MLSKHLILNIIQGDVEVLSRLLETEIDLGMTGDKRVDKPSAKELLSKAGAYKDDQFRNSLLHVAVATRNIKFVKLLLEAGCDVNSRNQRGESVLHFAAIYFERVLKCAGRIRHESLTKFLLDHGADVNFEDTSGESSLHFATRISNLKITRMLLKKGAYVNKRNIWGWTPLHMAVHKKNILLIELLLDNGADVSSESTSVEAPLILATYRYAHNNYDIIKLLLERGANCNRAIFYQSALGRPLVYCDCRTIKLLIDGGAEIRLNEQRKSTALHDAAINPRVDVLEYILDYGIDVNARDERNGTALHVAIRRRDVEGIKLLLSKGANINCINDSGYTPLFLAVLYKDIAKINLLLEYGAELCPKYLSQKAIMNLAKYRDIRIKNILIEHIAKLASLNIWVNEIELKVIEKDFEMKSYYNKCIEELVNMKIRKIYEDVCLFNILVERGMVSVYARNEDLIEALDSVENQLKHDFPIYYSLLKEVFYKEIKKQRLIKGAAIVLNEILNFNDPLHFGNLKILGYLNEKDIIRINETE